MAKTKDTDTEVQPAASIDAAAAGRAEQRAAAVGAPYNPDNDPVGVTS